MIRTPRSLLARILWWHGIAVLLTAVAVSAGVYLFLDATADHLERQTLRAQAMAVRDTLVRSGPLANAGRSSIAAGMSILILDGHGGRRIYAGFPPAAAVQRIPTAANERYFTRRSRRAIYAGLSVPVAIGARRVWIVAIQNLNHPANVIDDIVRQFLLHGLSIVLPLLLLLLGVDALIILQALRPVRRASALVSSVDPTRLDLRIIDPALPAEVAPLAAAVNTALDRLTKSLRSQRDFTADAAHELRTPITVARVRAAEIADPVLRAALITDLDTLAKVVGHLLDIAELDAVGGLALEPVDLSALAHQVVAGIAPLAFRGGKTIELDGADQPSIVSGQPHFIVRALGALLENAVKHTPAGTRISVRVAAGTLSVSDNGPGIAIEDQERVFRRFWRRDRVASTNAGLGLAIVHRVAQVHGGHVTLRSRPGLTVFALHLVSP